MLADSIPAKRLRLLTHTPSSLRVAIGPDKRAAILPGIVAVLLLLMLLLACIAPSPRRERVTKEPRPWWGYVFLLSFGAVTLWAGHIALRELTTREELSLDGPDATLTTWQLFRTREQWIKLGQGAIATCEVMDLERGMYSLVLTGVGGTALNFASLLKERDCAWLLGLLDAYLQTFEWRLWVVYELVPLEWEEGRVNEIFAHLRPRVKARA